MVVWCHLQATALLPVRGVRLELTDVTVEPAAIADKLLPADARAAGMCRGPVDFSASVRIRPADNAMHAVPTWVEAALGGQESRESMNKAVGMLSCSGTGVSSASLPESDASAERFLPSEVAQNPLVRAAAETACSEWLEFAGQLPPLLQQVLAAIRATGAEGVSLASLAQTLDPVLDPHMDTKERGELASQPEEEPVSLPADVGDIEPDVGITTDGQNPRGAAAQLASEGVRGSPLPTPSQAAMAGASAYLCALKQHGLIRRVPGYSHVAFVAAEHSQRYIVSPLTVQPLLTPLPLPLVSQPSAEPEAGTLAMASPSGAVEEPESGAAQENATTEMSLQEGSAVESSQADGSAAMDIDIPPLCNGSPGEGGTEGGSSPSATVQLPHHVAGESTPEEGLDESSAAATAATAPAGKREVVTRPWLEYRGALNEPLWRELCMKAVTTVLRHPGVIAHLSIHALCRAVTIKCKLDICVRVRFNLVHDSGAMSLSVS